MIELTTIGDKVNNAIEAVWKSGLNIEELEKLEEYIAKQEAILPLTDPIFIQRDGFKLLDRAKERIRLLKPIVQLEEKEKD